MLVLPARYVGLHYTHASQMIDAGVSISVVPKRLGHAHANISLGAYTHQLRDSQAKAACFAADLVRKAANQAMLAEGKRVGTRGVTRRL